MNKKRRVLTVGAFLCKECGKITRIDERGQVYVLAPVKCKSCGRIGPWRLLLEESTFGEEQEKRFLVQVFPKKEVQGSLKK